MFGAFLFALSDVASAQTGSAVDSFAVYQSCFEKAATELFASGITQAGKLEKATRKRCKAERKSAILDEQVRFMLNGTLAANFTRNDMVRSMDRVVARPTMKRLGFEGY
jgi:hypothetical protein